MKALVANMVTEDKFPSCLDLLDPPNNGKNKYSLGSSFQSFIKKTDVDWDLSMVGNVPATADNEIVQLVLMLTVFFFYNIMCVLFCRLLQLLIFLCAYYGWQAPMVLAFRQPSVDIFAMCLIICRISLW